MEEIKQFIENHIPQMDSPQRVYQLFEGLGYKTLDPSFRGKEAFGLREKEREAVRKIYTIANYQERFQILLVELTQPSSAVIRDLPLYFERETQYPFFVLTSDYRHYTFVLVEKIREGAGVWKRKKIVRLNLDRENAYYTDKWILSEIAVKDEMKEPLKIYGFLREAFGVQKVTKKFFAEYKENFDFLVDSLKKNNRGVQKFYDQERLYAFAQRFLGRLMFLYFLQKKGWLAGDRKFIPNWFKRVKGEGENFHHSVLEPLFFDTLNRKRPNDDSPFGKIPFLNGGLFEKEYDELVYIPDETIEKILNFLNFYNFTISEELPLEVEVAVNPEMLGRIFESMLPEYERGKKGTFYTPRPIVHYMCRESLKEYLASSTEIPRYKILRLIESKETKELSREEAETMEDALTTVRILDPAVGSGAFLVGMMQEIVRLRQALNQILSKKIPDSVLKKEIIQENLYGVDIEYEAVEIARLRLWLSLVVDEDKPEPLPNLDYKILQGNSLIETIKGYDLLKLFESGELELKNGKKEVILNRQVELFNRVEMLEKEKKEIEKKIIKGAVTLSNNEVKALKYQLYQINNQLKKLKPKDIKIVKQGDMFGMQVEVSDYRKSRSQFVHITDPIKRKEIREELEAYEKDIFQTAKNQIIAKFREEIDGIEQRYRFHSMPKIKQDRINRLNKTISEISQIFSHYEEDKVKPFFLPQWEFKDIFYGERGGFDIVIANPPYVRTQKLSDLPYREDLKDHHGYIDDLYVHFTFRAFELTRPKGVVTFITSDTYLTLAWKERMRQLLQNYHIKRLILTPKAFEATVNTAIYIVQKEPLKDYNFTFVDAREIGRKADEDWEDKLIVFEELKEIESYDTQIPVKLENREIEVSYNRYADVGQFRLPVGLYKNAVKRVFFPPTQKNLKLYEKFMPKMNELYKKWWDKIKSSRDIQKNKEEIESYLKTLKPGDITLLGLITEGGQGLATADNGRFLAVLEGTEEARRIEERLKDFEKKWKKKNVKIYETYQELVEEHFRNDALDNLRKKFGEEKLSFPRGFIYKIIKKEEVFDIVPYLEGVDPEIRDIMRKVIIFGGIPESQDDIKSLWKLSSLPTHLKSLDKNLKEKIEKEYEKLCNKGKWLDFTRGGEAESIFWCLPDRFIDWSSENVKWLFNNSGRKGSNMPVIRNPQYYVLEGVTYIDVGGANIKARILTPSIYDHTAHSFFPDEKDISPKYLLGILNTPLASYFANEYLNHTMHFELNDIRLFPIVIPIEFQREEIEILVDGAIQIQKKRYATKDEEEKSKLWGKLQEVQKQIDRKVEEIYGTY